MERFIDEQFRERDADYSNHTDHLIFTEVYESGATRCINVSRDTWDIIREELNSGYDNRGRGLRYAILNDQFGNALWEWVQGW